MFRILFNTMNDFTMAIVLITLYREVMIIVVLAVNDRLHVVWLIDFITRLFNIRSRRLENVCIMVNVLGWFYMNRC